MKKIPIIRNRTKNRGFSLVEVMIAMFVTAACSMIVAMSIPVATMTRVKTDTVNRASGIVQKQLEAIRGLGYVNANPTQLLTFGLIDTSTPLAVNVPIVPNPPSPLPAPQTFPFSNSDSAAMDNPALVLPSGSGTVEIVQLDIDLTEVIVTVNWKDKSGNHSFSGGTILASL